MGKKHRQTLKQEAFNGFSSHLKEPMPATSGTRLGCFIRWEFGRVVSDFLTIERVKGHV